MASEFKNVFDADCVREEKKVRNVNLPCISIKPLGNEKYTCGICHKGSFGEIDIEGHLKNFWHRIVANEYGCYAIVPKEGNAYYCRCCDLELRSHKLALQHVILRKHMNALKVFQKEEQLTIKKIPIDQDFNRIISLKPLDMYKYYCKICDLNFFNQNVFESHVNGKVHREARINYGCDQISIKYGNVCYCVCEWCDCTLINHRLMSDDVKEAKHISNIDVPCISIKIVNANKYHCRLCNVICLRRGDLEIHVNGTRHVKAQLRYGINNIEHRKDGLYHCSSCDLEFSSHELTLKHIKEKKHMRTLALPEEKDQFSESIREDVHGDKHITKGNAHIMKNRHPIGSQKSHENKILLKKNTHCQTPIYQQKFSTQIATTAKDGMRCNVCNALLNDEVSLHIHLAQHFKNDFVTSNKNEKSVELNQVTKPGTTRKLKLTEDSDCNGTVVKKFKRTMNMKKIIIGLDVNVDHIYSMEDKTADTKLGIQLCYPINKKHIYCFVCQEEVDVSTTDYVQHLRTLEHLKCLDEMEEDHSLFACFPDQFSQLDLARQYIMETENDLVYCLICDLHFNNIEQHICDENHREKCVQLDIKANENFENVKLENCDWYQIQSYWCVPCSMKSESEVDFAKHLESEVHATCMKQKKYLKKKLLFDFCASCALLWYGDRCTAACHENDRVHTWLMNDRHYISIEIPESAEILLTCPEGFVNQTIEYLEEIFAKERAKEATLIRHIEKSVETEFLNAKAYMFGSRVSGLSSPDSDIDIFLDCGNMYDGESSSLDRIFEYMTGVRECLSREPHLWDVEAVLPMCRSPIIRTRHRSTGLLCDISFKNGLAVENTLLIKSFNDIFPPCRKLILLVKEWSKLCRLSGSDCITNYAIYWCVIFYLQKESILPSVATLIRMKSQSHIIAGWEVGVIRDFTSSALEISLYSSVTDLLSGFFKFYANFDYRYGVACPLLGEVVAKRVFAHPDSLPVEMGPYKAHVKVTNEAFPVDSVMCIQDPFDLQHNLTKAVDKVDLNRFRNFCLQSFDILNAF